MNYTKLFLIPLILLLNSCENNIKKTVTNDGNSEYFYKNAQFYTVSENENERWAQAMLVRDGVIVSIGKNEDVEREMSGNTVIVDLDNKMVIPGFHDVQVSPLDAGASKILFTLSETEDNATNYIADIKQKGISENPISKWILGAGFDLSVVLDATQEPIQILDGISTAIPITIISKDYHTVWVNSKALELAKIDENTPNPVGGVIMKGDNKKPNGLLMGNAANTIIDMAVATVSNSEEKDYNGLIDTALPILARNGITSISDARTYWKRNHHLTWKKAEDAGKLTVRVNLALWVYPAEEDAKQISDLKSLYSNNKDNLLKINQIKLYADGNITNTTAAMNDDYLTNLFKLPTNNGLNYISESRISKYIEALEGTGFDFDIHAVGDRGVNQALNAIQKSGSGSGRHRLTNIQYISSSDYGRFKQLNVTADAQVSGDFAKPENWHNNDKYIKASLGNTYIPIKDLQQADARITLSSDWNINDIDPFVSMQNALIRTPQELSIQEVIKAYTINAAYLMRQEDKVGSLEVGKEADFVVLSQNIFDIDKNQVYKTQVLRTYLKGKLIYQK